MGASGYFHFDCQKIKKETDKAFLVSLEETGEEVWIPKSVIADVDDYEVGDKDLTLSIQEWWASKEGLSP